AADGNLAMSLPNQISPRIGVIYDFTHEGRSRLFANYARYYESVPLDIIDREGSGEPGLISFHDPATCDPRDAGQQRNQCQQDSNPLRYGNPPKHKLYGIGAGKGPTDPDIKPTATDEVVFGAEYEVMNDGRLGVSYTRRWLNYAIEDMSRDEAQTYFFGNPG